jgi:hypothetical protein
MKINEILKATSRFDQWYSLQEKLPPQNRSLRYRTELYQKAGRVNQAGEWRDLADRKEPLPVVSWKFLL